MKVFVYGTLKPREQNYHAYCEGKAIAVQPAYTYGKLYHLTLGYPAMTVGTEKVQGYLLTFADESNLVELDELETFDSQRLPENNEYQREMIPIYDLEDRSLGKAWGYLMNLKKIEAFGGIFLPSGWWKGARD